MIDHDQRTDKLISREAVPTRSIVIVPVVYERDHEKKNNERSVASRVEEALGLAGAIRLEIIHYESINLSAAKPATLLGSGKVDEIKDFVADNDIELAVVDHSLTPVQQRNLERAWNCKVIDRTALILEIFGDRARTKEGVLQVELAHLNYQKGRLVRSWTHLERQRGGGGFLGGPGETQIEADRRILQDKIVRIKRELQTVTKTRALHRAKRKKTPHPVVALVGYTNAGKSTLFNRLTGAEVLAKDMLFATLDPTLRKMTLPHGQTVILSDTVGFISNLPTHLVAAFRATLEEVIEADLIIHVRDMSDIDNRAHAQDVMDILSSLDVDIDDPKHMIEVWNKADLLDDIALHTLEDAVVTTVRPAVIVSSLTGIGLADLLSMVENRLSGEMLRINIILTPDDMALMDWLYKNAGDIKKTGLDDGSVQIEADMTSHAKLILDKMLRQRS